MNSKPRGIRSVLRQLSDCSKHCIPGLLIVVLVATQSGCLLFDGFRNKQNKAPVAFSELPSKEQLIAHLVAHTEKIDQLQTDVRVSVDGLPNLRGNLVVEKPNRLRLNAGLLGVTELGIDVGSNQDAFWFWAKAASGGHEPGIYFAKHDEYQNSPLQQQIPIEPNWLIDALGLWRVEPNDRMEGPFRRPQDNLLELVTYRNIGNQMTFRKTALDPKYGWIVQQSVYDANGRLIAYANSTDFEHYPDYDVNLPSRIEITAVNPDGRNLKLVVNASRFKINSIYGDPNQLWAMPNPGDVPLINLVAGTTTQGGEIGVAAIHGDPSPRLRDHRTSNNATIREQAFLNNIR